MEKVNQLIAAGLTFADAVKQSLSQTVEQFTADHGMVRPAFSEMLNGRRVPDDRQLAALIAELGGTRDEWVELWFTQAQRRAKAHVGAKVPA